MVDRIANNAAGVSCLNRGGRGELQSRVEILKEGWQDENLLRRINDHAGVTLQIILMISICYSLLSNIQNQNYSKNLPASLHLIRGSIWCFPRFLTVRWRDMRERGKHGWTLQIMILNLWSQWWPQYSISQLCSVIMEKRISLSSAKNWILFCKLNVCIGAFASS